MPGTHTSVLPKKLFAGGPHDRPQIQVSQIVLDSSRMEAVQLFQKFETNQDGLTEDEAKRRLVTDGPNVLAKDQRAGLLRLVLHAVMNPLVILLAVLASISIATGDFRAGTVMTLMIVLGVGLKLIQEAKADNAAAKLKAMIVAKNLKTLIEVDGGVNLETGARLVKAGADALVAGSFVFGSENPAQTIAELKKL